MGNSGPLDDAVTAVEGELVTYETHFRFGPGDAAEFSAGVGRRSSYWGFDSPTFQLRGFNAGNWEETLDVAGYPRQSKLPPGYAFASPQPLTERQATAPRSAAPVRSRSRTKPA